MNFKNIPKITDDVRNKLADILDSQFREIEDKINHLFDFVNENDVYCIDYLNTYQNDKNNVIRMKSGPVLMTAFNFNIRNHIRICRLLELDLLSAKINAIRIFPNTVIPLHTDPNNGNLGRELLTYTIVTSGVDGMTYTVDSLTKSKTFIIPGKTEFILSPTKIIHGAQSGDDNYDMLQLQINEKL